MAQKFDNQWVFGYNWDDDIQPETYRLVFDTFPPRIVIAPGDLDPSRAYAAICDSLGNLQLYTNYCFIANGNGDIIPGGDTMTSGWEATEWCYKYYWFPLDMINLFLPHPTKPDQVYSFYKSTYKSSSGPLEVYNNKYKYAIVKTDKNNIDHKVLVKDKVLINRRLNLGQMTAVKHGNGRDWWLPAPEEPGNKINMILLAGDTVHVHHSQSMGPSWDENGGFQASFSPDGSKFARYNRFHGVYIYDFDRCSGMLGNLIHFPFNDTTQHLIGGCAISPNNRFLYLADKDYIYQFDLHSNDIPSSKQVVAVYDGHISLLWTDFHFIVNAPDGRMYITTPNATDALHVINRPNLPGVLCDVRQHDIKFPNPYGNTPNHPNYRLGPLDGSPCDTLGMNNYPLAGFRPEPSDTSGRTLWLWDISDYQPTAWHWDFGDPASGSANTSSDTDAVHTFPGPGFYTVCLTVSNAYGSDTKCKVVEIKASSADEAHLGSAYLRVWPNPSTGLVRFPWADGQQRTLRVSDATGRAVRTLALTGNEADLSGLPGGVYVLQVQEGGRSFTGKIVLMP